MDSGKGGKKSEIIVYRGNETEIFVKVKIRANKSLYRIPLDPSQSRFDDFKGGLTFTNE
jgi:hypothetical protein